MADKPDKKLKDEKKSKKHKEDKDPKSKSEGKSKDEKKKDKSAKDPDKKKDKSSKSSDASVKPLKESSRPSSGKSSSTDKANGSSQQPSKRPEPKPRQLPPPVKQKADDYLADIDLPSSDEEEEYETSTRKNDEEQEFRPQVGFIMLALVWTGSSYNEPSMSRPYTDLCAHQGISHKSSSPKTCCSNMHMHKPMPNTCSAFACIRVPHSVFSESCTCRCKPSGSRRRWQTSSAS